jgi:hypothetical protein
MSDMNHSKAENHDSYQLDFHLTKALEENRIQNQFNKNIKISRNKIKKSSFKELENINVNTNVNTNSSLRLLKSNLNTKNDDLQAISLSEEISIDSHRTDCEESKSNYRYKIRITPLDRISLISILKDYFVDCKIQNESEFIYKLFKGEFFNCLNEEKTMKPVKNHYIRRRVCYKLYKVFEKLVRISLTN